MSAGGFDVITIGHTNTATAQREHEVQMPRFGLGVWQMSEGESVKQPFNTPFPQDTDS